MHTSFLLTKIYIITICILSIAASIYYIHEGMYPAFIITLFSLWILRIQIITRYATHIGDGKIEEKHFGKTQIIDLHEYDSIKISQSPFSLRGTTITLYKENYFARKIFCDPENTIEHYITTHCADTNPIQSEKTYTLNNSKKNAHGTASGHEFSLLGKSDPRNISKYKTHVAIKSAFFIGFTLALPISIHFIYKGEYLAIIHFFLFSFALLTISTLRFGIYIGNGKIQEKGLRKSTTIDLHECDIIRIGDPAYMWRPTPITLFKGNYFTRKSFCETDKQIEMYVKANAVKKEIINFGTLYWLPEREQNDDGTPSAGKKPRVIPNEKTSIWKLLRYMLP